MSPRNLLLITAGYLLLFALIMAAATRFLGGTERFEAIAVLLFFLWLGGLEIIRGRYGKVKNEWAWIRRNILRLDSGKDACE